MKRKSIAQEYFILVINEKGMMPGMYREEAKAGVVTAGIMDLLFDDIITVEKKQITVIKDLPGKLEHMISLYTYLKEKPRSFDKLMRDYLLSTGSRLKKLTEEIGESLLVDETVKKAQGGLFGKKTIYIPEQKYKQEVKNVIKSLATEDGEITPHDMALLYILHETKNFDPHFSKLERKLWRAKWKEIKKNPQNKQMAYIINYISDMTAVMATVVLTSV
ncbi:MAG: GPP34 family phosphoprotein [Lachnospiraceae bacterium]|nr:GPP34 family phosphoprotein [Lachnospiraceae bacterium]